ncbi:MAG TPA: response regulator transcription factor, partial [Anaerolineales bacterium]
MTRSDKPGEALRVAIVDDHALFRDGLRQVLEAEPTIEVVGEGGSADEAIALARQQLPEVILLDIDMPGGGLEAARAIADQFPVTKIVMLTASEQDDHLIAALKAGARAFVLKGVSARELIRILQAVAAGDSYVPPALAASLLLEMDEASSAPDTPTDNPLKDLTEREREILECLAQGLTNKEIGERLFLAEKTVKHYMTNILQKLQVRNRVEAALLAQRQAEAQDPDSA